jgi:hypothetical protein
MVGGSVLGNEASGALDADSAIVLCFRGHNEAPRLKGHDEERRAVLISLAPGKPARIASSARQRVIESDQGPRYFDQSRHVLDGSDTFHFPRFLSWFTCQM